MTDALPLPAEVLPHAGDMVWIDRIVSWRSDAIVCVAALRAGHPLERSGSTEAWIVVEWMAQAIAALVGLGCRAAGEPVRAGYLVAVPRLELSRATVAVGQTVELRCTREFGDENLASFACEAWDGTARIAAATLNVYRPAGADEEPS